MRLRKHIVKNLSLKSVLDECFWMLMKMRAIRRGGRQGWRWGCFRWSLPGTLRGLWMRGFGRGSSVESSDKRSYSLDNLAGEVGGLADLVFLSGFLGGQGVEDFTVLDSDAVIG